MDKRRAEAKRQRAQEHVKVQNAKRKETGERAPHKPRVKQPKKDRT